MAGQLKGGYEYRQAKLLVYCVNDEVVLENPVLNKIQMGIQITMNREKNLKHLSVSCMSLVLGWLKCSTVNLLP